MVRARDLEYGGGSEFKSRSLHLKPETKLRDERELCSVKSRVFNLIKPYVIEHIDKVMLSNQWLNIMWKKEILERVITEQFEDKSNMARQIENQNHEMKEKKQLKKVVFRMKIVTSEKYWLDIESIIDETLSKERSIQKSQII